MSSSNETSPTRGISSWWKQTFKKNQSNDSLNSPPSQNIDDVLNHQHRNSIDQSSTPLTRPTLSFKSKSSNNVRPTHNSSSYQSNSQNEDFIRQQRDFFMASQNQKFGFGNEIFGVPLEESIKIAESLISVPSDDPNDFIHYGRIPLLVGKCGSYLKNKGLQTEGIFRVAGASRRVKELQYIFSTPPEYGRKLNWEGYTVHDAASLIRRFLNNLPEPLVPLALYDEFREPVKSRPRILKHIKTRNDSIEKRLKIKQQKQNGEILSIDDKSDSELTSEELTLKKQKAAKRQKKIAKDLRSALKQYRILIDKLPQAQKQLLFYLLDVLSMFADNSQFNLMPARNLAAIFQPSILSHPNHDLTPEEYALSQAVVELLIEYSKRLLPDVRKYEKNSANTTGTNESNELSYSNSVKNSSTNLLSINRNQSINHKNNRPHSRSLSSAGGVPDGINPKAYNNNNSSNQHNPHSVITSSGLTKNRTRSGSNLIENLSNQNHSDDDSSDDDDIYHPANSDYPSSPKQQQQQTILSTSPKIQIDQAPDLDQNPSLQSTTISSPETNTIDHVVEGGGSTSTRSRSISVPKHKPIPIPIVKTPTNSSNSNSFKSKTSPTSPSFHVSHFSRPRPLSMFTGNSNSSIEDFGNERESRWGKDDLLGVKKDPWYKRLRSSSRSRSEKE
ncbi:GTPase-activating protein [Wickerhamomyces ciferrii]|uniref:GTPase-activating protein n=1 Tax=Wickerhamomyces ciferrii (strain ATCC 14091 / BCRC 22168 / CBS 111 / JCM 3599 / NBRC 0793 / NRRL Y-1031 F-60-10) TaxID=1206466 RepID=K0KNH2_WICCF|nr:GTPase-activating protein [Wickerhamomyces ciferrii]CCH43727.1 GTPase-activating protein [Wickerhamomyces ciferrii]